MHGLPQRVISFFLLFFCLVVLTNCSRPKKPAEESSNTLTYYTTIKLGEHFKEYIQQQTGIKVNFIPPQAYGRGTMDILLSSGTLPDIIECVWNNYKYTPQKLIHSGYILELNQLIEENSPNFKHILDEYPQLIEQLQTPDGSYYSYPMLRLDPLLRRGLHGLMIREDWLKDLNLATPVTLDDFEQTLAAFKEKKGADCPFVDYTHFNYIISAYGIIDTFFMDGDTVCFGPAMPAYKDALTLLKRWYQAGYINLSTTVTSDIARQYVIKGKSGLAYGYAGSFLGSANQQLQKQNENYRLIGIANPVLNRGDAPAFNFDDPVVGHCAAISASCKHPELAARFLDYGYSPSGQLLYNFGLENYTFVMNGDYPTYTNIITNDILSKSNALGEYARPYSGPFVQRQEYLEQYYATEEQTQASIVWQSNATKTTLPDLMLTETEHEEAYAIRQTLDAYVTDMSLRFILGLESLENFDSFVETLKQKQADYLTNLYQTAYNRSYGK